MPPNFPGMNPYLETSPYWEVIHGWFIRKLAELHIPAARAHGCEIDVERRVYQRDPAGQLLLVVEPDAVAASAGGEAPTGDQVELESESNITVAEAVHELVLQDDEELPWQDYLVIRERSYFRRVLAVVELLSPRNKDDQDYCRLYREKLRAYEASQSKFMEIDLLRAGSNPSRDRFPELPPSPYFVYVDRKLGRTRKQEGYPIRLQTPLPTINLPLGPDRGDLPLDLSATWAAVMTICWRDDWAADFIGDPPGPLSHDDLKWVRHHMQSWRQQQDIP